MKEAVDKMKKKKSKEIEPELFSFDNEIIIGIKKKPEENKKKKQKKKTKPKAKAKYEKEKKVSKTTNIKEFKDKKRVSSFLKGIICVTIFIGTILFFMLSPIFNIKEINIENNIKVEKSEIIKLSRHSRGR